MRDMQSDISSTFSPLYQKVRINPKTKTDLNYSKDFLVNPLVKNVHALNQYTSLVPSA